MRLPIRNTLLLCYIYIYILLDEYLVSLLSLERLFSSSFSFCLEIMSRIRGFMSYGPCVSTSQT